MARWVIDGATLAAALVVAFLIRFDGSLPPNMTATLLNNLPFVVALQLTCLAWWRVPRRCWSLTSASDLPPIAFALTTAAAVMFGVRLAGMPFAADWPALHSVMLPVSVIVIDLALGILGVAGARCLRRLQYRRDRRRQFTPAAERERAVLIGAGWSGAVLLQELRDRANLGVEPVAFVDDDPCKLGRMVGGLRVVGTTADIDGVARRYGAKTALISIANADGGALHRIVQRCRTAQLHTKIVPHIREIVSGSVRVSQFRDVRIEDLLGRQPVAIENSQAHIAITDKVALVTGAGGSIGSELCRQIVRLRPRRLVLVERTENSLYEIHRELSNNELGVPIVQELADITDRLRMAAVFAAHAPHVVMHAAAHKHVPMMELVPGEAIKNNLFGTKTVADLADEHDVERFLLVSTDKAVNPTSVMGATKRLAELYIRDLGTRSKTRFTAVRFGNVMGSAGSVIPLFREQIRRGGPVTVTDPEMERYFMTIPEASRLVLEAAGLGRGGEVMVLDMGEPVKIRHLAEQMIKLSGFEPNVQIPIRYTGMRPGEKLYEELSLPEEMVERTQCQKLFVWRGGAPGIAMAMVLDELRAPGESPDEIRATLRRVLPDYNSMSGAQVPALVAPARPHIA